MLAFLCCVRWGCFTFILWHRTCCDIFPIRFIISLSVLSGQLFHALWKWKRNRLENKKRCKRLVVHCCQFCGFLILYTVCEQFPLSRIHKTTVLCWLFFQGFPADDRSVQTHCRFYAEIAFYSSRLRTTPLL